MNRVTLGSAMDICTRNTEGTVWPKPENAEHSTFLPPVRESHPSVKTRVVTSRVLRVTRKCYVTLLTTLHSHRLTPKPTNQPKEERATANAAADGVGYVVRVLNTFAGVVR